MRVQDRLELAELVYRGAVAAVRVNSTAPAWRRLVRAGENLRQARGDVHREAARTGRAPPRPPPATRRPAVDSGAKVIRLCPPVRASFRERWPELAAQCERARQLARRARALVEQSRRLRQDVAEMLSRRRPSQEPQAVLPARQRQDEAADGAPRALDGGPTGR